MTRSWRSRPDSRPLPLLLEGQPRRTPRLNTCESVSPFGCRETLVRSVGLPSFHSRRPRRKGWESRRPRVHPRRREGRRPSKGRWAATGVGRGLRWGLVSRVTVLDDTRPQDSRRSTRPGGSPFPVRPFSLTLVPSLSTHPAGPPEGPSPPGLPKPPRGPSVSVPVGADFFARDGRRCACGPPSVPGTHAGPSRVPRPRVPVSREGPSGRAEVGDGGGQVGRPGDGGRSTGGKRAEYGLTRDGTGGGRGLPADGGSGTLSPVGEGPPGRGGVGG